MVLLNNLGSTTNMELAIVGRQVCAVLDERGIEVERVLSGTFVSSLDMAGVSISLMKVDDERLKLLDAPTSAPAWPRTFAVKPEPIPARTFAFPEPEPDVVAHETATGEGKRLERAVAAACQTAIQHASELTELDQAVGDGDLGSNMARAAEAVLGTLRTFPFDDQPEALKAFRVNDSESARRFVRPTLWRVSIAGEHGAARQCSDRAFLGGRSCRGVRRDRNARRSFRWRADDARRTDAFCAELSGGSLSRLVRQRSSSPQPLPPQGLERNERRQ